VSDTASSRRCYEDKRPSGVVTVRMVIGPIEGTVAMCRAARSAQPLNDVQHELEAILTEALAR